MNILESLDHEAMLVWQRSGHVRLLKAINSGRPEKIRSAVAGDRGQRMFNAALHNAGVWADFAERVQGDASEAAEAEFRQARWENAAAWVADHDSTLGPRVADQQRKLALALLEKVSVAPVIPEGAIQWRDGVRARLASSPELGK